jgi:cell division protein FtsB
MPLWLKNIWSFTRSVVRNKYILSLLVFAIWISFFGTYNLYDRIHDVSNLKALQTERDFFKEEIQKYRQQIDELESSQENLEKFAREQHLMKSKNGNIRMNFYLILTL